MVNNWEETENLSALWMFIYSSTAYQWWGHVLFKTIKNTHLCLNSEEKLWMTVRIALEKENKYLPGMTVMVFSARRTLNVLRAETLPKSTNSVRYLEHRDALWSFYSLHNLLCFSKQSRYRLSELQKNTSIKLSELVSWDAGHYAMLMTMKSSQFQGSLRKVKSPMQNPLEKTLTVASKV